MTNIGKLVGSVILVYFWLNACLEQKQYILHGASIMKQRGLLDG